VTARTLISCFFSKVSDARIIAKTQNQNRGPNPHESEEIAGVLLFAVEKISSRFRNSCLAEFLQRPLFDLQRLIHKVTVDRPGKIEPFMFG